MSLFADLSSPLEHLDVPVAERAGVRLWCKRDDRLSPAPGTALQGNKVRKLAPTLRRAVGLSQPPLLVSFGGAYSNHASALATAGRVLQLRVHLFIRGEEVNNPVLRRAAEDGAVMERITRSEYRRRSDADWCATRRMALADQYAIPPEDVWFIPEGGTSPSAIAALGGLYREIERELGGAPDYLALSAGTGGTAAGLILAADAKTRVEVFSALRGDWMPAQIEALLPFSPVANWNCINDYHFGGYGRYPREWRIPATGLATRANIGVEGLPPLEAVYTSKLFFGVLDRIRRGLYPTDSSIVVLHTGGIY